MSKDLTEFCLDYWEKLDRNETQPEPQENEDKESIEPTELEQINQQVYSDAPKSEQVQIPKSKLA